MSTFAIPIPHEQLVELYQRWTIRELAVFGSVLRDDCTPRSDVDMLVTFAEDAKRSLVNAISTLMV
jgi:predicted nucleotidyltransferase